jgi:hypothetical protein
MTRYSIRFKAPPYLSCFRLRPKKGACTLSRSRGGGDALRYDVTSYLSLAY